MIRFISRDLKYVGHENKTTLTRVGRDRSYIIISFVDQQTKRRVQIYDWSGSQSAALTFERFTQERGDNIQWYIDGYVNTSSSNNYLVLQHFGIIEDDDRIINPYTEEEGRAEVGATNP